MSRNYMDYGVVAGAQLTIARDPLRTIILNDCIIVRHQAGDEILILNKILELLGGLRESGDFYEVPNFFGSKGRLPCKPHDAIED